MWNMVFLTGLREKQLAKLDTYILYLLFEFSIEYDINAIREGKRQKKAEKAEKAPPSDDVMKALGYKEF